MSSLKKRSKPLVAAKLLRTKLDMCEKNKVASAALPASSVMMVTIFATVAILHT